MWKIREEKKRKKEKELLAVVSCLQKREKPIGPLLVVCTYSLAISRRDDKKQRNFQNEGAIAEADYAFRVNVQIIKRNRQSFH